MNILDYGSAAQHMKIMSHVAELAFTRGFHGTRRLAVDRFPFPFWVLVQSLSGRVKAGPVNPVRLSLPQPTEKFAP